MTKNSCLFLVIFFLLFFLEITPAFAQHFSSTSYNIDWGNFNSDSGSKTSPSFQLTDTVGQIAPGQYNDTVNGVKLKSGFQYIYDTIYPFSFSISSLAINFGSLVPNVGTSATSTLTISSPSGHGYQILASEDHPLQLTNHTAQIPDTTCDNGTCTESTSAVWTSNSIYGFGLNVLGTNSSDVVTGIGTSQYFADATYYRQFANISGSESPQTIMSEPAAAKQRYARVTYKVNISGSQDAGNYANAITYTAVPNY